MINEIWKHERNVFFITKKKGGTYAHYSHETGLDGTYDVFNRAGTIDDRHRSEVHYKTSKEVNNMYNN